MVDSVCSSDAQVLGQRLAVTALGAHGEVYVQHLAEQGYAPRTIEAYVGSVEHFARWLDARHFELAEVDEALIRRFVDRHLPRCRCRVRCRRARHEARPALRYLVDTLRVGGESAIGRTKPADPIAAELEEFDRYLVEARGLSMSTRSARQRHLRRFLTDRFGTKPIRVPALLPADVADFIERYTAGWATGSVKQACVSVRSYFSFRATRGEYTAALKAAIPQVAQWRLGNLPQILSPDEIHQLLNAFDRSTATGKRDFAIVRCLLDLGLRRAEVAGVQLEDMDWRAGTMRVHAKGPRVDLLPLPETTGRAIADYLRHGRPQTTRRELFVRHRPPINAPADPDIVRGAVRNAARRCGLEHRIRGTHVFRHTLAGRLLKGGARYKEIADLLRHRSLDTTTIYAKVDFQSLERVALPWPGRQP